MAWRDNSVTSPKMADSASSAESSTDDDRPQRPTRNHNKRGFNGTLNNMDYLSEDDGLDSPCIQHNDIVNVNGVAGRAMLDTTKAQYDPELPNGLLRELLNPKTSKKDKAKDKEPRICVLLFDPENKWGWYPIADVTPVDNLNADHRELTHESLLKARNWYKAEERRLAEQKN